MSMKWHRFLFFSIIILPRNFLAINCAVSCVTLAFAIKEKLIKQKQKTWPRNSSTENCLKRAKDIMDGGNRFDAIPFGTCNWVRVTSFYRFIRKGQCWANYCFTRTAAHTEQRMPTVTCRTRETTDRRLYSTRISTIKTFVVMRKCRRKCFFCMQTTHAYAHHTDQNETMGLRWWLWLLGRSVSADKYTPLPFGNVHIMRI